ncbi:MAG: FMN-binding protein [Acidobacteriota bacterium]
MESAQGVTLTTVSEALEQAFPGCRIERRTEFLTAGQTEEAGRQAGDSVPSALVVRYVASRDGVVTGIAYTDTHRVRTMAQTVLVVVEPDGAVARVEVVSFAEPAEYVPRPAWYRLFAGRRLDGELSLTRAIRPVTGATLTSSATTRAVRRVLAIHSVLDHGGAR